MKKISIIAVSLLETDKSLEVFKKVLISLLNQEYEISSYEIIVVITDKYIDRCLALEDFIQSLRDKFYKLQITLLKTQRIGIPAKKNLGIRNAQAGIVLFLNADCIASKQLIREHLSWHKLYPEENIAVLGHVTWHPDLKITPFLHWLDHGGPENQLYKIKTQEVDVKQSMGANISFKKALLSKNNPLDEDFTYPFEDTIMVYNLSVKGLRVMYNKEAIVYHYHDFNFEASKKRMLENGKAAVILSKKVSREWAMPMTKYPFKQIFLILDFIFLNPLFLFCLEKICLWAEKRINLGFIYDIVLLHYRIEGMKLALSENYNYR